MNLVTDTRMRDVGEDQRVLSASYWRARVRIAEDARAEAENKLAALQGQLKTYADIRKMLVDRGYCEECIQEHWSHQPWCSKLRRNS